MLLDHVEGILNYCRAQVPPGVVEARRAANPCGAGVRSGKLFSPESASHAANLARLRSALFRIERNSEEMFWLSAASALSCSGVL